MRIDVMELCRLCARLAADGSGKMASTSRLVVDDALEGVRCVDAPSTLRRFAGLSAVGSRACLGDEDELAPTEELVGLLDVVLRGDELA